MNKHWSVDCKNKWNWLCYKNYFSVKKGMKPADLKTLCFVLPESDIETWYGFSCFAEWR